MTYIENVFICISVPLLLSLLFVKGALRRYTLFLCIGMGICMVSAYVNSFLWNCIRWTVSLRPLKYLRSARKS